MNHIYEMKLKQEALNDITRPRWRTEGLNFRRAVRQEASEAMESTAWEWWKKKDVDIPNIVIEATDMMHFALSVALVDGFEGWEWLNAEIDNIMSQTNNTYAEERMEKVQDQIDEIIKGTFSDKFASHGPHDIVLDIVRLMWLIGMSKDDMYKIYFGKNILNEFRQSHGYKDGTYKKIWDGEEDNVRMVEIATSLDITDTFADDLMDALEARYKEVKDGEN